MKRGRAELLHDAAMAQHPPVLRRLVVPILVRDGKPFHTCLLDTEKPGCLPHSFPLAYPALQHPSPLALPPSPSSLSPGPLSPSLGPPCITYGGDWPNPSARCIFP
ncbi:unnamed protein product [Pleuronectes platessa]|uniref:Uncharacterized protein n=1 Tax=Pleuronectes platessa TaxID=8262 RepID=A0A9N7YNL6_PLEPL|nr:unnamed protein product [Pleuronectes platessa]